MKPSYQAQEIRELSRIFEKGLVYRGKKPVYWCMFCTTALAEAEVEYSEKKDPSIYVKFPIKKPCSYENNYKAIFFSLFKL